MLLSNETSISISEYMFHASLSQSAMRNFEGMSEQALSSGTYQSSLLAFFFDALNRKDCRRSLLSPNPSSHQALRFITVLEIPQDGRAFLNLFSLTDFGSLILCPGKLDK